MVQQEVKGRRPRRVSLRHELSTLREILGSSRLLWQALCLTFRICVFHRFLGVDDNFRRHANGVRVVVDSFVGINLMPNLGEDRSDVSTETEETLDRSRPDGALGVSESGGVLDPNALVLQFLRGRGEETSFITRAISTKDYPTKGVPMRTLEDGAEIEEFLLVLLFDFTRSDLSAIRLR